MSRMLRALYFVGGFVALGLGAVGVIVPLLPTTPLVILAAALFARSSPRMHQRLVSNRVFGPLIVAWNDERRIPRRAKVLATTMIVLFGSFATIVVASLWWLRAVLITVFVSVLAWLWSRPS